MKRSSETGPSWPIIALISSPSALIGAPPTLSHAPGDQPQADDNERRRQNHPHRQTAAQVLEARIGVAKEFAKDPGDAINPPETAAHQPGPTQRPQPRRHPHN